MFAKTSVVAVEFHSKYEMTLLHNTVKWPKNALYNRYKNGQINPCAKFNPSPSDWGGHEVDIFDLHPSEVLKENS